MARSNKYTSLNFNDIYDKKLNNNNSQTTNSNSSTKSFSSGASFANPSKTALSNSRIHGHMLVLSRPTPKPISIPQKPPTEQQESKEKSVALYSVTTPDQARSDPEPDSISLRPQGRTGPSSALTSSPLPSPVSPSLSPVKTNRFVPPHLRPGFVGKEEKPDPEFVKGGGGPGGFKARQDFVGHHKAPEQDLGHYGSSPNRFEEDSRPKSGGGYERMRRDGDPADLNRPGSVGTRPSSSG